MEGRITFVGVVNLEKVGLCIYASWECQKLCGSLVSKFGAADAGGLLHVLMFMFVMHFHVHLLPGPRFLRYDGE
jgi:hypothetical protein